MGQIPSLPPLKYGAPELDSGPSSHMYTGKPKESPGTTTVISGSDWNKVTRDTDGEPLGIQGNTMFPFMSEYPFR